METAERQNKRQTPTQLPKGSTVLEAAKAAEIDIPTLCYLKDINEIGACRLCLVEVSEGGKPFRLVTACVYPLHRGDGNQNQYATQSSIPAK